jgi:hypothetical protein
MPDLEGVPGISEVHAADGALTCQLEGDPTPLVTALQGFGLRDLLIEPARLEEAFMEYYAEDGQEGGATAADDAVQSRRSETGP